MPTFYDQNLPQIVHEIASGLKCPLFTSRLPQIVQQNFECVRISTECSAIFHLGMSYIFYRGPHPIQIRGSLSLLARMKSLERHHFYSHEIFAHI